MSESAGTPYRLILLGTDRGWADAVAARVDAALQAVVRRPGVLGIERALTDAADPASAPPHAVVAFLADEESRDDARLVAALESARDWMLPVLPLVHSGATVHEILPAVVRPLNAEQWDGQEARATGAILRLLGLVEGERKLFLSYRRSDTNALALQLRRSLDERSYDVFLDRFSVPPAADFQRRIDIELSDKAFVLLLESPAAAGSEWVQHEVAYALSHGISILALSLPETAAADRFASVPDAFRYRLAVASLEDGEGTDGRILRSEALHDVLDRIEMDYARQLRRRRTELLGSLADWLQAAGAPAEPTHDEWALSAPWPPHQTTVFLITPRPPTPRGLRRLDELRGARDSPSGGTVNGCLVYDAAVQDEEDQALVRWIVDRRPLTLELHARMPERLSVP